MSVPGNETLTSLPGVRVGQMSDRDGATGVTVIVFDVPAAGAVLINGTATSTRQIDALLPHHPGGLVHALCLCGGSAFGLGAADGVVRFLEEQGVGLDLVSARVPVVPTAVIFDLPLGDAAARPTAEMAYEACVRASDDPVRQGSVGAGTGASCGKLRGVSRATKAGLGSAVINGAGVHMGSLVVANPFGDVLDASGRIIAGARDETGFMDMTFRILAGEVRTRFGAPGANTTLAVLVTDAALDKAGALFVARMAAQGLARHIAPFNTPFDGDLIFVLSVGGRQGDLLHLGVLGAEALSQGLLNAVRKAETLYDLPAARDLGMVG